MEKKQNIKIKIPINSNNEVVIKNKKRHIEIPIQLKKEIRKAFENKFIRDKFINDLIIILKNYKTILTDEERVNDVLKILSHYFELNLIEKNVITFSNNKIISITNFYKDDNDVFYFITINEKSIRIGQLNKFFKHQIGSKILK